MRRTLLALALGIGLTALAGAATIGCKVTANKDFCDTYLRCVGFDPKQPGCKKDMKECSAAYSGDEFSAACMAKANATMDAGIKRPADYCSELCAVCD